MRRIRLYDDQPMAAGQALELGSGPAKHLLRVLRRQLGDEVVLFNGDGQEYEGRIVELIGKNGCRIEIDRAVRPPVESPLDIVLAQAIARGERMDWAIQKAVELGVTAIQPVFSERCEVRLDERREAKRLAHWQGVVVAACEQSGRARVPEVHSPIPLDQLEPGKAVGLYLDPEADLRPAELQIESGRAILIAIGPEGGFSQQECDALSRRGFRGLRLGPRVLRTETAGAAAIAMLQTRFGDW